MKSGKGSPVSGFRRLRVRPIALGVAAALFALGLSPGRSHALPVGEQVTAGTATVQRSGSSVTVTQSTPNAAINWQAFGIAAGEAVRFSQPAASSIVLNRVVGQDPSQIMGSLSSNGQVFLLNPNGVLFGAGAQVSVGGLVASTLSMSDADFMAGRQSLTRGSIAGSVVNHASIVVPSGGYVALIAPQVVNAGSINSPGGTVALAAGDKVTLTLDNGSLLGFSVDQGTLNGLVENRQAIRADGGVVILTAKAMDSITRSLINNTGIIEAGTLAGRDGAIWLEASDIRNSGTLASSQIGLRAVNAITLESGSRISADGVSQGRTIDLTGGFVGLGGTVSADGVNGGTIRATALGTLSLAENVSARGLGGAGGRIEYKSGGVTIESNSSVSDVSGATVGGSLSVNAAGGLLGSGTYRARGETGEGGRIDLSGGTVRLLSAQIDASGATRGGLVRIGGAYQGGRTDDLDAGSRERFVGRFGDAAQMATSARTFLNDGANIDVSARGAAGDGGTAIVWSNQETTFLGAINATGALRGGAIELSSKDVLRRADLGRVDTGPGGLLLLDPKNIVIGDPAAAAGWSLQAILGSGYSGGKNVDLPLDSNGGFATVVALNSAGDRLAVGSYFNDGASGANTDSGAVHLFTFTDRNFSGGALAATLGSGYTGGRNVNVPLDAYDYFGTSVALNAAGDRLAVGAYGDAGASNANPYSGAVRLFTFTDSNFSGGALAATIGSGYTGGNNVNVALDAYDLFGSSVALSARGDRLAAGAMYDGGAGNANSYSGAVRLFTFADTSFSAGALAATLGSGYAGGNNVNVALDPNDNFGVSVGLNGAGDRLAVGAYQDGGAGNANANSGAVRLFTFNDTNFSGGTLSATLGSGYTGGKNVNVALDAGDKFGVGVALNAAGDRLAVGTYLDDGAGNAKTDSGAVHLFSFTDRSFSGGALAATFGSGYTGGQNVNVALDAGDGFGEAVALNGSGDRLAVSAYQDAGVGNANPAAGAVYLYAGPFGAQNSAYSDFAGESVTVSRADLERVLGQGTAVTLQASNDITVASAINVNNASGNGGALTLQAGRSLLIDQGIVTDNGNLTLIGNDTLANGVVDAHRDPGAAVIAMAAGTRIDAGTGAVVVELRDGAGKANRTSGHITLGSISAGTLSAVNNGVSAGNMIVSGGATLTATGIGNSLVLAAAPGGNFINSSGPGALSAPNGRWLVYSTSPEGSTENGLTAAAGSISPRLYNRTLAADPPASITEPGNHLVYGAQPLLAIAGADMVRSYGDANPAFTYSQDGFVIDDGFADTASSAGLTGIAELTSGASAASNVGLYAIRTAPGTLASGAGYGFKFVEGMLTIDPRGITVTADNVARGYGDENPVPAQQIVSGNLANGDLLSGSTATIANAFSNVGAYAITQGTLAAGANYVVTFNSGTLTVGPRGITITAGDTARVYGDANPAFGYRITSGSLVDGDVLGGSPASIAGAGSNVGTYAITQGTVGVPAANPNYALAFNNGTLTISPRAVTVTANGQTKIFGDPDLAFTFSTSDLGAGSPLAGFLGRAKGEDAGRYAINEFAPTGAGSSNYLIGFLPSTLEIEAALPSTDQPAAGGNAIVAASSARAWAILGDPCDSAAGSASEDMSARSDGNCAASSGGQRIIRIVGGGIRLPAGVRADTRRAARQSRIEALRSSR